MIMRKNSQYGLLVLIVGLIVAVKGSAAIALQGANAAEGKREILTIPIAVFILVSDEGNDFMSSRRTVESMEWHFAQVNNIWSQADIVIEPVVVRQVAAPDYLLKGLSHRIGRGGIADFFRAIHHGQVNIGRNLVRGSLTAFYVRSLGGPNGLKPLGINTLFVADNTTVKDARVTSHEIGHNLGLYHAWRNTGSLLFSGSNGVVLTETEQSVARYNARRFL